VQLYRYFMSQFSEFCRHNPLRCFSASACCCCVYFVIDSVRKLLDITSYTTHGKSDTDGRLFNGQAAAVSVVQMPS